MANSPLTLRSSPRQTDYRRGVCAGNERNVQRAEGKAWKEECGVRKQIQVRVRARHWSLLADPMQMRS